MQKLINIIKRKEFIIAALIIVVFLVYILFFKPNPLLRLDTNKLRGVKAESALSIDAPGEVSSVGKTITVKIMLDTMGNSVNAVQSYLQFDPKVLEITKSDTEQSFCKFYPENNYDNDKGLVKLSCGSPYPGFRGQNTLQEIEFITKAIKTTTISLTDKSMVLANDGKGTNLLKDLPSAEIKIKAGL